MPLSRTYTPRFVLCNNKFQRRSLFCVKRKGFLDLPSPRMPKSLRHVISSDWPAEFACLHMKLISDCVDVSGGFSLTAEKIASYPSYSETKEPLVITMPER